jgi:hypothetical protein
MRYVQEDAEVLEAVREYLRKMEKFAVTHIKFLEDKAYAEGR